MKSTLINGSQIGKTVFEASELVPVGTKFKSMQFNHGIVKRNDGNLVWDGEGHENHFVPVSVLRVTEFFVDFPEKTY